MSRQQSLNTTLGIVCQTRFELDNRQMIWQWNVFVAPVWAHDISASPFLVVVVEFEREALLVGWGPGVDVVKGMDKRE